jgi:tetratricopeptide (TPR) repeat protein
LTAGLVAAVLAACDREAASPPRSPGEVLSIAEGLERRHRVSEALSAIESRWKSAPRKNPLTAEDVALREKEAALLLALSRPADAVEILEEISPSRPGNAGFSELLAKAYMDAGDPGKAVALLESLPRPFGPSALFDYGNALVAARREKDGAAILAACLIRDPWWDAAYLSLGRALSRLGSEATAKLFLERYRSGEAYRRGLDEARQLEFDGDEARGLHRRAKAEGERGRLFELMELENQTLQKNPGLGAAYVELARLSLFLERPADAIRVLEQLPQDPMVLDVLKDAREKARERSAGSFPPDSLERTRSQVRARMQKKPLSDSIPALLLMVEAYEQNEKKDEAKTLGLFLLRLAPGRRDLSELVARAFLRPDEGFVRLWAMSPFKDTDCKDRFDRELSFLGVDPVKARNGLK